MKKLKNKIREGATIGELHKQRSWKYRSELYVKRQVNDFRFETRSDKLFK